MWVFSLSLIPSKSFFDLEDSSVPHEIEWQWETYVKQTETITFQKYLFQLVWIWPFGSENAGLPGTKK